MSLDFYLHEGGVPSNRTEIFWRNATHNLTPMWSLAGCYDALYDSEGKLAREIVDCLRLALIKMEDCPDDYIALNPANGWGNYPGAVNFLRAVKDACAANPDGVIRISK